jgi:hypothetical protein
MVSAQSMLSGLSPVPLTVPSRSMYSARARNPDCRSLVRLATLMEPLSYEYMMCTGSLAFLAPKNTPAWSKSYPYNSHCSDGHALFICR